MLLKASPKSMDGMRHNYIYINNNKNKFTLLNYI